MQTLKSLTSNLVTGHVLPFCVLQSCYAQACVVLGHGLEG